MLGPSKFWDVRWHLAVNLHSSKHLTSLLVWGSIHPGCSQFTILLCEMLAADWNVVTKIILANNEHMKKPTLNNYCSCFTDDSETKKPKLQWTVGSMTEISVWEQYNIFSWVTLYLMTSLPILFLHLLLWTPSFQNLMVKNIFWQIWSNKTIATGLRMLKSWWETGFLHSQNSLVKDVSRYGLQDLFKNSPRIHSVPLNIAQIYYFYRLWRRSKFLQEFFYNAGGKVLFPMEAY